MSERKGKSGTGKMVVELLDGHGDEPVRVRKAIWAHLDLQAEKARADRSEAEAAAMRHWWECGSKPHANANEEGNGPLTDSACPLCLWEEIKSLRTISLVVHAERDQLRAERDENLATAETATRENDQLRAKVERQRVQLLRHHATIDIQQWGEECRACAALVEEGK